MEVVANAKGKSSEVRGAKGQPITATPDSHSETKAVLEGSGVGRERVGTDRESRSQGFFGGLLLEGILEQLISQAEDQLREAQECISWYQRAEEKARKQLENLNQLRQIAEQETDSD